MQYRNFGELGVKVSALGFGAMRLPMKGDHVDMDKAVPIMQRSFELGVNYIDTAFGYCNHESQVAVGKALKGWREVVYLSTKNPEKSSDGKEWRRKLDVALERLDVDYIDFYHLHDLRWDVYTREMNKPGGPMEEARKAQSKGLFKHIGFSSHDTPENIMKLIDTGIFKFMTVQYNLLDRRNEKAIAYAHGKGMGVVIMGPVGGGRLAAPSQGVLRLIPEGSRSAPDVALRFVLSNPYVSLAISGMNTMAMVEENVATASRTDLLSAEERRRIEEVLEEKKKLSDLYCTGCNYCMPCPNGVDIPKNFLLMNYYRLYDLKGYSQEQYAKLKEEDKWADACVECGECEPKCPQNIPIIEQLEETHAALNR